MNFPKLKAIPVLAVVLFCMTNILAQSIPSSEPTVVKQAQPAYPVEARKTGLGGKITVRVVVDEKGKVVEVESVDGPDWTCRSVTRNDVVALRKAASESAKKVTFSPAVRDGTPVRSTATLVFYFGEVKGNDEAAGSKSGGALMMRIDSSEPKVIGTTNQTAAPPSGVLNGKAVVLTQPVYPAAARAVRASGSVNVQVLIETDGTVFSAMPISGHPLLRPASAIAACSSRFTPTLLSGDPVRVAGIITYNFNL